MARVESSAALDHLRTLFHAGTVGNLTDGQLLERFVVADLKTAEHAFTVLVERHGPMVLGVCRRILQDPHDAADAFQGTFLVLVRRATALRVDDSLGRWLYGVSRRVAMQARKAAVRRSARQVSGVESLVAPSHDPEQAELLAALDDEIVRLPAKYQAAVILCDLEGLTHEAAARHLGCPIGTVESRLARGRQRLRASSDPSRLHLLDVSVGPGAPGAIGVGVSTAEVGECRGPRGRSGHGRGSDRRSCARFNPRARCWRLRDDGCNPNQVRPVRLSCAGSRDDGSDPRKHDDRTGNPGPLHSG